MSGLLGVGVIGLGVMGAEHARLLSRVVSGCEVAAVSDVDRARSASVAQAIGARVHDDPMVLIKDDGVDAVLIASSDATHEQFVLACLAAGKPVLCEKPLAPDVEGCRRIVQAESDVGDQVGRRLVGVGFMRRYDPGYGQLKAAIQSRDLGRPLLMHCVHRNAAATGQTSAMLISGSAVHEIDAARWLLGEEVESVAVHVPRRSARAGTTGGPLMLVLTTASGVLIDVELFMSSGYGYEVRCELVGERGTVTLDSPAPTSVRSAGRVVRPVAPDWRARFEEAYRRELQDWVDGVAAGGSSGAATAWDGYVATAVAEAAIRALEGAGTQRVRLPDRPGLYG